MAPPTLAPVKKESESVAATSVLSPTGLNAKENSASSNSISPSVSIISSVDKSSAPLVAQTTSAVKQIDTTASSNSNSLSIVKTNKRKEPCKPSTQVTSPPSDSPPSNGGITAIKSSPVHSDVALYDPTDELLDLGFLYDSDDEKPAKKQKDKWEPVVASFDASQFQPVSAAKDDFKLAPNGAAQDTEKADLTEDAMPMLTLRKMLNKSTPQSVVRYCKEKKLPAPLFVQVVQKTASIYITFRSDANLRTASKHDWTIGVVDQNCLADPYEDHSAWHRLNYGFDISYLTAPLQEIGGCLAAFGIAAISANFANGDSKSVTVYVQTIKDFSRMLKLKGPLLVASVNGKEVTILSPRHDLAQSSHRLLKKLYVGGLPHNPSEEKTLDLLAATLIKAGYDGEAVLSFHLHHNEGNSRSTYGYAQVKGIVEAEHLVNSKISIKGGFLTVSYATKSKGHQ